MFWYVIICVLMFYPFLLVYIGKRNGLNVQKFALKISCVTLLFFMAMRSISIGVDTKFYSYAFKQLSAAAWKDVASMQVYAEAGARWTLKLEIGYRFYNKLVGCFCDSPQAIVIVNSCIIFFLLYRFIYKRSSNYMLSIWLYLTLGIFQTEMNVTRNAIAILLCYLAFQYIEKKQFWKYSLLICIAATFHKSVFVFIPLYFLLGRKICSAKRMLCIVAGSVICGIACIRFGDYIQAYFTMGTGRYLTAGNEKSESLLVGGFYIAIIIFIRFMMKKEERRNMFSNSSLGSWIFMLNLCCFGVNIGLKMAARVAALFGAYMIIFVPELINQIPDKKRRRWVIFLVAAGCGLQYVLRMMINNIGGTMPYRFFW